MKKIWLPLIIIFIVGAFLIFLQQNNKKTNLTKIKVAEVTHSIFYTPQYVAHALGYFEEEGLDVEFILTPGVTNC